MKPIHKAVWFTGTVIVAVMIVIPPSVWSDTIAGLNVFTAGETASSSEVNANFTAIASAVNGNDALIADHETRIQDLESVAGVPGPQGEQGEAGPPGSGSASFELVGFTSSTHQGGAGILAFTRACQAEFPGSRMCKSAEVFDSTNVPVGLSGTAWLRPSFIISPTDQRRGIDISGIDGDVVVDFTCIAWGESNPSYEGLAISPDGTVQKGDCDVLRAVACCGEVP